MLKINNCLLTKSLLTLGFKGEPGIPMIGPKGPEGISGEKGEKGNYYTIKYYMNFKIYLKS